jgi:hypothetical protein
MWEDTTPLRILCERTEVDHHRGEGLRHVYNKESETQCHTAEARATAELHQLKKNCHNRDRKTFVKLYK